MLIFVVMIAVITGDIINSHKSDAETLLNNLKELFQKWGTAPKDWEIYRGDEFQLKSEIDSIFMKFLAIKSLIKAKENLDVRISIGIGEEQFSSDKITESNGTAYVNSGRLLNDIKTNGKTFSIKTTNEKLDLDLNMVFGWSSLDFDNWTTAVAEIIHEFIVNPTITQEEIAKKLDITQSSVSQRLKRANLDRIIETDKYFRKKIAEL